MTLKANLNRREFSLAALAILGTTIWRRFPAQGSLRVDGSRIMLHLNRRRVWQELRVVPARGL
jgi:hypothetical protein